jgi:hypothetical protein
MLADFELAGAALDGPPPSSPHLASRKRTARQLNYRRSMVEFCRRFIPGSGERLARDFMRVKPIMDF